MVQSQPQSPDTNPADAVLSEQLAAKRDALLTSIASMGNVAVAFSGGVDSAVVAKAAALVAGDSAVAITANSASLASGELDNAREVAKQIGIRLQVLETDEFANADYVRNASNRCYFCKTELYTRIAARREELGVDVVLNGANVDDQGDHRPGMIAATEHGVRSPLIEAGITKAEVRALARAWSLPVWDKPATPCLSSRIAYGVEVTAERVQRVDAAESFLRERFDLRELRVRHEDNELARVEVPVEDISRLMAPANRQAISDQLRLLGFRYVTIDLDGFRSGSMNDVIPLEIANVR